MTNSVRSFLGNNATYKIAVAFALISFVGLIDATYLAAKFFLGESPACSLLKGCESVTTSEYAVLFGVPVALLGAVYYGCMLIGTFVYFDTKKESVLRVLSFFTIVGLIASAWFMYLQLFVLYALCLYCIASAASSTLLFILGIIILLITANKKQTL